MVRWWIGVSARFCRAAFGRAISGVIGSALAGTVAVGVPSPAVAGTLALHPVLMLELNKTLNAYDGLHEAMYQQQDEQIDIRIRDVIRQIERASTYLVFAKTYERGHLRIILEAAYNRLERAQTAYGEERRDQLEAAVNDLVNLVRIYRVDKAYGIFFCARDKKSWVQRGYRPHDPFATTGALRDCGFRVKE
jgi:hypothetical protein